MYAPFKRGYWIFSLEGFSEALEKARASCDEEIQKAKDDFNAKFEKWEMRFRDPK